MDVAYLATCSTIPHLRRRFETPRITRNEVTRPGTAHNNEVMSVQRMAAHLSDGRRDSFCEVEKWTFFVVRERQRTVGFYQTGYVLVKLFFIFFIIIVNVLHQT